MNKSILLVWCSLSMLLLAGIAAAQQNTVDPILVGWHDNMQAHRGWHAEPWQAGRPDDKVSASFGPDGGCFEVGTPGEGMAWTRTINPVWVEAFPILQIEYELENGPPAEGYPQLLLFDDSTGPVTPNALNPENPLAGEHETIVNLPAAGGLHSFDLSDRYPSDRIARISLRMKADAEPTAIRIKRIAFMASAEHVRSEPAEKPLFVSSDSKTSNASAWKAVQLPEQRTVSSAQLAFASSAANNWPAQPEYTTSAIPFRLGDAEKAALATGVMEEERLEVNGEWRGSELGLLLASRVFGNDAAWYGPNDRRRVSITSPHQLVVQLEYADGSSESHFPRCPGSQALEIKALPAAYVVPLNAGKTLTRFAVADRMTYGQVFLLAASVNTEQTTVARRQAQPHGAVQQVSADRRPASWSREGDRIALQNSLLRLVCDLNCGPRIAEMSLVPFGRSILNESATGNLFELQDAEGKPLECKLDEVRESSAEDGLRIDLRWTVGDPAEQRQLDLRLQLTSGGPLAIRAVLQNGSAADWQCGAVAASLRGVTVANDSADAHYLMGTRNTILGNQDIDLHQEYGGPCPMALMDVYAAAEGGGLGIYTVDSRGFTKSLRLKQTAGKADLGLRFAGLSVPAETELELPEMYLLGHAGDWHDVFNAYRREARTKFKSRSRLSDTFYCRRDYPLGGTDYLFDLAQRGYTPKRLMNESARVFGGLDMIDISGWAYHEKTGRVGDYLTNDLGGLEEVRRLTSEAHQAGAKVGLYFEGYLIDKRCKLAERAFPSWQMIRKDGKPWWWSGQMEFFTCPGVKAWREEMARMIGTVARQTGVDAVYVDQFGITTSGRACWSPDHDHPVPSNPLHEERLMLETIRGALDQAAPDTALYIEYVPPDCMIDLVDSAFDFSINDRSPGQHPTKLPLYRYAFPELAAFQMVGHGIRPVPFEADDLHRSVFHGMGLWLKGRGESWFTSGLHDLARRARRMYAEHGQVFRSADCEPLIPTLHNDLYANRFAADGKTIYTVYNAGASTISGDLLRIPLTNSTKLTDLLADTTTPHAEHVTQGEAAIIRGTVEPWSVAVYLLQGAQKPAE